MKNKLQEQISPECNVPVNIVIEMWVQFAYIHGIFPYTIQDLVNYMETGNIENSDTGYSVNMSGFVMNFNLPEIPVGGDETSIEMASLEPYGINNLGDLLNGALSQGDNTTTNLNSITWLEPLDMDYSIAWGTVEGDGWSINMNEYSEEEMQSMISACTSPVSPISKRYRCNLEGECVLTQNPNALYATLDECLQAGCGEERVTCYKCQNGFPVANQFLGECPKGWTEDSNPCREIDNSTYLTPNKKTQVSARRSALREMLQRRAGIKKK
jgi:hypothetical protein